MYCAAIANIICSCRSESDFPLIAAGVRTQQISNPSNSHPIPINSDAEKRNVGWLRRVAYVSIATWTCGSPGPLSSFLSAASSIDGCSEEPGPASSGPGGGPGGRFSAAAT